MCTIEVKRSHVSLQLAMLPCTPRHSQCTASAHSAWSARQPPVAVQHDLRRMRASSAYLRITTAWTADTTRTAAPTVQEETGWKLVHGDVFRPPPRGSLLATYVGSGVQLLGMSVVTMIFAVLGFLSPANRGGLMTAMLLLYVFMGIFGGYAAARLYKQFKGDEWRTMTLRTSVLFPGTAAVVFFSLNMLVWGQASSGAVPFSTFFALCFLWFGVSVPLVFTGSYLGFKREALEDPVRTNKIPRQVRLPPPLPSCTPLCRAAAEPLRQPVAYTAAAAYP